MASSVVDICNNALVRLGGKTITSLSDGDKTANTCSVIYERTRDTLLRMHLWNFAIKRETLAAETSSPNFEYAYQFPLPSDFIRVKALYNTNQPYKIEGSKLLTDSSTCELIYVSKVTDVTKFDPLFTESLTLLLAINLAFPLMGSTTRESSLRSEFKDMLFIAKQVDGQDDTPDQFIISTPQYRTTPSSVYLEIIE
ncbi:MAG: hypothetical protein C0446_08320 [Chitinophaga sp.]|nr:hypothetical protein [Chitinophaga sp.]